MIPRSLYWMSGFALCGAIKVAIDGDWARFGILLAVVALCEIAAWDIRRPANAEVAE